MATNPRLLTVEEFLAIHWDDPDAKAELDNGVIRMMSGGSVAHARIQGNVQGALFLKLEGTACRPFGPDMGLRMHDLALRYPDVSVYCGHDGAENDCLQSFDDPWLVVEVLSPSTRKTDTEVKLPEYRAVAALQHILYIDPDVQTVRQLTRTGPRSWNDADRLPGEPIELETLGVTLDWNDIFGRR